MRSIHHLHFVDGGLWIQFYRLFIRLVTPRFAQTVGKKGQHQPRNTGKEEGKSPHAVAKAGHNATRDKADHQTNQRSCRPTAHHLRPLRAAEVVAQQGCTSRIIAGLTYPQHHARNKKPPKATRDSGKRCRQAPDGNTDHHDVLAVPAICPDTQRQRTHRVNENKRSGKKTYLVDTQPKLLCYDIGGSGKHVAVQVVEQVDAEHYPENVSCIATGTFLVNSQVSAGGWGDVTHVHLQVRGSIIDGVVETKYNPHHIIVCRKMEEENYCGSPSFRGKQSKNWSGGREQRDCPSLDEGSKPIKSRRTNLAKPAYHRRDSQQ